MSDQNLLYPRLPRGVAHTLIARQATQSLEQLYEESQLHHAEATPSATGGHPADIDKLDEVRSTIRRIALEAGYPKPLAGAIQTFDRPCGTSLFSDMRIVPADAAEEGVWSFLTLVLVPEIGPWRFPKRPLERLLGEPRNVLRKTWWRAWALGPDLDFAPPGCAPLGEDETVQIMERPVLGYNRRTAQALQAALWRAEVRGLDVPRSHLVRELTRRALGVKSHLQFEAMEDVYLAQLFDSLIDEGAAALKRV
jgi:hypothetical protein